MPITKSAKKALRQAEHHRQVNQRVKRKLKQLLANFRRQPEAKLLAKVYQVIDIAAKKHLLHQNKARRLKSQLARKIKATASKKQARQAKKKTSRK